LHLLHSDDHTFPSRRRESLIDHEGLQTTGANSTLHEPRFPTAHTGKAGPLVANAATFASFRPQGFLTLSTVFSLPSRADLVSCRQRSWDFTLRSVPLSPDGAAFPRSPHPRTVNPVFSPPVTSTSWPATRAAVSGCPSVESPLRYSPD
jgi:hypothetical protein